ncbi:MAG: hypothetical protein LBE18_10280 [Planctomycetaceae bacterium]|jgi:hypothetical protein|nr:hypothetical protein [Planctomycetaceae bacterium]
MSKLDSKNISSSQILSGGKIDINKLPDNSDNDITIPNNVKRKSSQSTKPLIVICTLFVAGIITCSILVGLFYESPKNSSISGGIILPAVVEYAGIKNIPGKRFTGIETTRTYQNRELTGEIKKVLQASALPGDIFKLKVPSDKNLAVLLKREFKIYHDNRGEFELLRKEPIFINEKVNDNALLQAEEVLERVDQKRLSVRKMLDDAEQTAYSFEIINIDGIGETPDISSAGYLDDYIILEEYAIARAIRAGKIRDAVIAIAYIFRIAQLTADVPNLSVRYAAAQTRLKAIDLVQNVVFAKSFEEEDLSELFLIILEQLETWSEESKTFIGYRASGMKTFNLILALGIEYAFENSELDELAKRDENRFEYKINQNWAWDHVFFLESMQKIIGECEQPYYMRRDVIEKILHTLGEKYDTPDELITSTFLLRDIPRFMQFYAVERTKCEIAALAMAHSLKNSKSTAKETANVIKMFSKELMTGKPYQIKQIINETEPKIKIVWASYFGNLKPFKVPDYSTNETSQNISLDRIDKLK